MPHPLVTQLQCTRDEFAKIGFLGRIPGFGRPA